MNVGELIEQLQDFFPSTEVAIETDDGYLKNIEVALVSVYEQDEIDGPVVNSYAMAVIREIYNDNNTE